jgi:sugar/nucleoside kinase (ribokinase family)
MKQQRLHTRGDNRLHRPGPPPQEGLYHRHRHESKEEDGDWIKPVASEYPRLVFDPISREKALKVVNVLGDFAVLKPNHVELAVLLGAVMRPSSATSKDGIIVNARTAGTGEQTIDMQQQEHAMQFISESAAELVRRTGAHCVVCTCGPRGCVVSRVTAAPGSGDCPTVTTTVYPPPDLKGAAVQKVTGAGDSFLAGFLLGRVLGLPEARCVLAGNSAAKAALTTPHVVSPHLTRDGVLREAVAEAAVGDVGTLAVMSRI